MFDTLSSLKNLISLAGYNTILYDLLITWHWFVSGHPVYCSSAAPAE